MLAHPNTPPLVRESLTEAPGEVPCPRRQRAWALACSLEGQEGNSVTASEQTLSAKANVPSQQSLELARLDTDFVPTIPQAPRHCIYQVIDMN